MAPQVDSINYNPVSIEAFESNGNDYCERQKKTVGKAFRVLGCLNNLGYVIMLASAKDLSDGGTALVFVVNAVPGLFVKLSAPYWFDKVSYTARIRIASLAMTASFFLVGLGSSSRAEPSSKLDNHLRWQLLGVSLVSFQCALGEASLLALAGGRFNTVAHFSSGTGFAGPAGFLWNIVLGRYFGWSLRPIVWAAMMWSFLYAWVYETFVSHLAGPVGSSAEGPESTSQPIEEVPLQESRLREERVQRTMEDELETTRALSFTIVPISEMTGLQRMRRVLMLWPYIFPLFLVYAAEYICQAGTWTVIGFPIHDISARNQAYQISNFCYQTGVLISRSSGNWFTVNMKLLWILPMIQVLNLTFFTFAASHPPGDGNDSSWYYNESVIYSLAVFTGLLGGAVYVHGYQRVTRDVTPQDHCEFALSAVSVAEVLGVVVADVLSLWWQACLYKVNGIPSAIVSCPI